MKRADQAGVVRVEDELGAPGIRARILKHVHQRADQVRVQAAIELVRQQDTARHQRVQQVPQQAKPQLGALGLVLERNLLATRRAGRFMIEHHLLRNP